ncbi:hypothetical protein PVAND_010982 [Polypedilum vanderplanki]|uniref:dihydropyrimidinase n=1 Tax=Polypedilum vanderplanki TaxID=319348 RepID=A0A9J6CH71_POLVA|nr:hypothetical protein PVAND_010982 [Polypedilum vanderplanki]
MDAPKPVKKIPIHVQSSQNRLYIKRARVVNHDSILTNVDIYIEDGTIKFIGSPADFVVPGGVRVIDVAGKYVFPGGIDPNTQFESESNGFVSADTFYSGTKAAVAGGTTCIIDLILPNPGESLIEACNTWRTKADGKVVADYALRCAITSWNKSVSDEMKTLCEEFGINCFVVFMAFKDQYQLSDSDLYEIFERCNELGALCQVHAENGDIIAKNVEKLVAKGQTSAEAHDLSRSAEVEAEAVNRACVIAHQTDSPIYITKVSSKLAADQIQLAKRRGTKVYGEILAASIGCNTPAAPSIYTLTSPPLRLKDPENSKLLLKHVALDDIQVVASGNCSFTRAQKEENKSDFTKVPNGVNGAEDRLKIVWEKCVVPSLIDLQKFVAITSTNAAKIFNLYPKKGSLTVGSDADILIWNHQANKTISSKTHSHASDYNIFEGVKVSGAPEFVIVKGKVCYEDDNPRVAEGFGNYIELSPYSQLLYGTKNGDDLSDKFEDCIQLDQFQEEFEDRDYVPEKAESIVSTSTQVTHTARAMRQEGQRDLQASSFSISKEICNEPNKACIRVRAPPGGKSSGLW